MPNELDFPTAIGQLAEATGPCGGCNGNALVPRLKFWDYFETLPKGEVSSLCPDCDGTGRIPLFPSLRVVKQGIWSHADCAITGECENLLADGSSVPPTSNCNGRGWVPEPDVQVACWEITRFFWDQREVRLPGGRNGFQSWIAEVAWQQKENQCSLEEAVICATLAWVKEQHGKQNRNR